MQSFARIIFLQHPNEKTKSPKTRFFSKTKILLARRKRGCNCTQPATTVQRKPARIRGTHPGSAVRGRRGGAGRPTPISGRVRIAGLLSVRWYTANASPHSSRTGSAPGRSPGGSRLVDDVDILLPSPGFLFLVCLPPVSSARARSRGWVKCLVVEWSGGEKGV